MSRREETEERREVTSRESRNCPRTVLLSGLLAGAVTTSMLAVSPAHAVVGTPAPDGEYAYTVRLDIGDGLRACSGVLVDQQWILTATSCFADDPEQGIEVPAGKPATATTATIARTDLTTPSGQVRDVVELVPRGDRDLVLARLATPVPGITPVAVSATAPAAGEELRVAGYGRTQDEWSPLKLHTGTFTVDSVNGTEVAVTGQDGASVCAGDTGGPALRVRNGQEELVAVNSRSWQGGCFGVEESRTGAVETRLDDIRDWISGTVTAPSVADFNCDGQEDIAVGDPRATVAGHANAGLVRILHGGDQGTDKITQDLESVPGVPEAGDRYGGQLATFDHNLDGCTDLVVGVPDEDIGDDADSGSVQVLYGSRAGLGKDSAALDLVQGKGEGGIAASEADPQDRMGHAVAAGHTVTGEPYLVIGVPGEDHSGAEDAGSGYYLRGDTNVVIDQEKPGVPGNAEKSDRLGASVAASPRHVAVGVPGEAIGADADSGSVQMFDHELSSDGIPVPGTGLQQDLDIVNGGAEPDDRFGSSLSMVAYRPEGATSATDSLLAVGSPGEDLSDGLKDAGRVVTFQVTASGDITQAADIQQGISGVTGAVEEGDSFGEQVSAVNTAPSSVGTAGTMLLAVGAPGEDIGNNAPDAGTIQVFSMLGAPGDTDVSVEPGKVGLPGVPAAEERNGTGLATTPTQLYVGMPDGPAPHGAVHTVPWVNVTDGADEPVTTYQPGVNGLPAEGQAFGAAIR